MSEYENPVAEVVESMTTDTPADDAQAAEVTAEEVIHSLLGGGETAENEGDGGPAEAREQEADHKETDDKFSRRMRAALANQKRQLYAELGGSEEEIREIVRKHRAAELTKENPKISPEAAQMIVEEREKAQVAQPKGGPDAGIVAQVQSLIDDGWSRELLTEFVKDEIALEQINADGVSVRKAAFAFLTRRGQAKSQQAQPESEKRRGVPTVRTAATSAAQGRNLIEEMSDEEYAKFSKRVESEMLAGKKIRL